MVDEDGSVFAAMRAGARGYVLKGAGPDEILRSILRSWPTGEAIFGPAVAARLTAFFAAGPGPAATAFPELTARERDILTLMATGAANAAIAARLGLTEKTVRNNVSNVFAKLRVADRAAGGRPGPRRRPRRPLTGRALATRTDPRPARCADVAVGGSAVVASPASAGVALRASSSGRCSPRGCRVVASLGAPARPRTRDAGCRRVGRRCDPAPADVALRRSAGPCSP